jgi:hypothetical protein
MSERIDKRVAATLGRVIQKADGADPDIAVLREVAQHIHAAMTTLGQLSRVPDARHWQSMLQDVISSDSGEAGIEPFIKQLESGRYGA